jgi:hypothetical protein
VGDTRDATDVGLLPELVAPEGTYVRCSFTPRMGRHPARDVPRFGPKARFALTEGVIEALLHSFGPGRVADLRGTEAQRGQVAG